MILCLQIITSKRKEQEEINPPIRENKIKSIYENGMRTITTILYQDSPTGIKTIEFSNRLIKGILIPRTQIKDFLELKVHEIHHAWVYFLIGLNEQNEEKIYVWQTVNLQTRLEQHNKGKDFWHSFLFFTNKENSLIESDLNYLEKELIQRIIDLDNVEIENKTIGNPCLIQNNRKADMHDFLEDLRILLGNLGFGFLEKWISLGRNKQKKLNQQEVDKEIFYYSKRGSNATWEMLDNWFLVHQGSICSKDCTPFWIENWFDRQRLNLLKSKILKQDGDVLFFNQTYLFKSPSWAASVLSGANKNWWIEWKGKDWRTLEEIKRKPTN